MQKTIDEMRKLQNWKIGHCDVCGADSVFVLAREGTKRRHCHYCWHSDPADPTISNNLDVLKHINRIANLLETRLFTLMEKM